MELQSDKELEYSETNPQTEIFEYPPKPEITDKKQTILKSIYSVLIFGAAFYFLFGWDLVSLAILIGIILIHELGHFTAMKLYNYKDLSIFFVPLVGAFASGEKDEVSQKQQIIISLAGPIPGIIIGSVLAYFGWLNEHNLLYRTGSLFLFLNIFNLLPVLPMDGGRIIQTLFFNQKEAIIIALLWISIVLFALFGFYTQNWIVIIVCLLIFTQVRLKTQYLKVKKILKNKGFNIEKNFSELTNEEYWKIREVMASNMRFIGNLTNPDNYSEVAGEKTIIKAMKNIFQKPPTKSLGITGKILFFLTWLLSFTIPIIIFVGLMIWKGTI